MDLFDSFERTDLDYASRNYSWFEYLNRSARPPMAAARALLESWFLDFPQEGKADLRGRFRLLDNRHAWGAYLELLLHAVFKRAGFDVDIHLPASGGRGRADLTLARRGLSVLRVEARAITTTWTDIFEGPSIAALLDKLDQIKYPPIFLRIELGGSPKGNLPYARLARSVEAWIRQLPAVQGETAPGTTVGTKTWRCQGLKLRVIAVYGKGGLLVSHGCRMGRFVENIRDGLTKKKATHYGKSKVPYAIAVGLFESSKGDEDVFEAVFGDIGAGFSADGQVEERRRRNGFWVGPKGVQNTWVGGVIYVQKPLPFSLKETQITLLQNPWAEVEATAENWPFRMVVPNEETGKLDVVGGLSPAEVLEIPEVWPLEEQ